MSDFNGISVTPEDAEQIFNNNFKQSIRTLVRGSVLNIISKRDIVTRGDADSIARQVSGDITAQMRQRFGVDPRMGCTGNEGRKRRRDRKAGKTVDTR